MLVDCKSMVRKFFRSFGYAFSGIAYAFNTQFNFKFHTAAVVLVSTTGCYFRLTIPEWLWIISAIGFVLITELLNTAIEVLVDLVSPAYHEKAKIVKDVAAGAVLISAVLSVLIGLLIFIPKIISYAS